MRLQVCLGVATRFLSIYGVDSAQVLSLAEAWQDSLDALFSS